MHVDRSEGEKVILKVLLALSFSVVPYQLYAPPQAPARFFTIEPEFQLTPPAVSSDPLDKDRAVPPNHISRRPA
jgi:hypothetical protein